MDPRRVFHRLSDKFKDKNLAYKEVVNCYENLIKLLKFPNLEFRYISAHLESFGVLESESLHVLTLPLRTSPHQLAGAIKIEDKKICDTYMDMFYNLYKIATPLTEALVRKIVKQKLKEIRSMMRAPNSD